MAELYEPIERYRDELKERFAQVCREKFESLLAESGVDEAENARLMTELARLNDEKKSVDFKKGWLLFGIILMAILLIGSAVALIYQICEGILAPQMGALFTAGILLAILLLCLLWPKYKAASQRSGELQQQIDQTIHTAEEQMAPLNRLFFWDIPVRLMEQAMPEVKFDPYPTQGRLNQFYESFDWDDSYNDSCSVLFAHTGEISGNPFAILNTKEMNWVNETYTGTLHITWTTRERGSDGKYHTVHHSQLLTAHVTKPKPAYSTRSFLFYFNDAAPELRFSRHPTGLADGDGFFDRWAKKREVKKLREFSRNLTDDSNYTMMSNEEFEVLFHATDRNDEVAFRLLFTSLAQTQMVQLLKDNSVGFGDNFIFSKYGRHNLIASQELLNLPMDTNPSQFWDYDLARARNHFQMVNEEYFKVLYFSFAPLLAIPIYQQVRSHESIYHLNSENAAPSFWEAESMANYLDRRQFHHPACITDNILKAERISTRGTVSSIRLTAHGFRGVEHTEFVPVYGNDNRLHQVPVKWVEYLPVEKETIFTMDTEGRATGSNTYDRRGISAIL